jgi:hypothetical protein
MFTSIFQESGWIIRLWPTNPTIRPSSSRIIAKGWSRISQKMPENKISGIF